jgi:hypothetical protein
MYSEEFGNENCEGHQILQRLIFEVRSLRYLVACCICTVYSIWKNDEDARILRIGMVGEISLLLSV